MVVATGCKEGIHIYNTMMTERYALPGLMGMGSLRQLHSNFWPSAQMVPPVRSLCTLMGGGL